MDEVCSKCGEYVEIDGEYPKVWAWCDTCGDYATGVDAESIVMEQLISQADSLRKDD